MTHRLLTRSEVGLAPPKKNGSRLTASMTTVHFNGPPTGLVGGSVAAHKQMLRSVQRFHMNERGWNDIAYSWGIGQTDQGPMLFELRGLGVRTAANGTDEGNSKSHALYFMVGGNETVSEETLRAAVEFCASVGQPLRYPHSHWKQTTCPGDRLRAWANDGFPLQSALQFPPAPPPQDGQILMPPSNRPTLSRGSTGRAVEVLQYMLRVAADQRINVDGVFGPATELAVKNFQVFMRAYSGNQDISTDGIAGPQTWWLLDSFWFKEHGSFAPL